ncbi:helix-turn-helix transcriptional regulator [Mesorhizobium sp. CN2-181]|uniref:helix-turn-helix domain-containing protein n=1 Tax=Mesorhizobium yinganensis TaxID=3157707 RepID=UPI0032B70008
MKILQSKVIYVRIKSATSHVLCQHEKCNWGDFMLTSAQCRAARALLEWSREELAAASKVAVRTVVDFERNAREPREVTKDALQRALEAAGVIFVAENGEGPGVRLKKR